MGNRERREINAQKRGAPSVHHIICQSRRDQFQNLNMEQNKLLWNKYKHERFHTFNDNLVPHETLQELSFFMQVMSEKAKKHLQALLNMTPEEFYNSLFVK